MEIEELQSAWQQMSRELENQKKLTDEIILKMTQEGYKNKFKKIILYESMGAFLSYALVIVILFRFSVLDTWYLKISGVVTVAFLGILPTIVLRTLHNIQHLNITTRTYKETLIIYTKTKNKLIRIQQIGIGLSFVLIFFMVPVAAKILVNKNMFTMHIELRMWISMAVVFILVIVVSRWGYKSYLKITDSAAKVLKDLE